MRQQSPGSDAEGPPADWWRSPTLLVLALSWMGVLLYHLVISDDPLEIFLDLVLLVVGLGATATALSGVLRTSRSRLSRAERQLEVMGGAETFGWECDPQGRITFVGDRVELSFGYQPHELVGRSLVDVIHPVDVDRLTNLLVQGEGWREERWRCIVADGSERWFLGSAEPHVSADGTVLGFTGSARPLARDELDEQRLTDIAVRVYDRLQSRDLLPVFQPILSVETGRLIGAEALSRFPGSSLTPDRWFTEAAEVGLGVELELMALERALLAAKDLPRDVYLSLNASPQVLVRPELSATLRSSGIPLDRIVLEVTEHSSVVAYDDVLAAVAALRAEGVRLAVDDAGAGYASFRHILRLAPEIIKLDRSLIAGLDEDPAMRALGAAVVTFASEMGSTVTAEGIETPYELRCLQDLGIDSAQGYLFGRPTHEWSTWNEWHARGPLYSVAAAGAAGGGR
jgi:PAS domain S-box-containing protein